MTDGFTYPTPSISFRHESADRGVRCPDLSPKPVPKLPCRSGFMEGLEHKRACLQVFIGSPLTDSNRRPPPYHGTSQATGRNPRQQFSLVFAASGAGRICHWLPPVATAGLHKGSIFCWLSWRHPTSRSRCRGSVTRGAIGRPARITGSAPNGPMVRDGASVSSRRPALGRLPRQGDCREPQRSEHHHAAIIRGRAPAPDRRAGWCRSTARPVAVARRVL